MIDPKLLRRRPRGGGAQSGAPRLRARCRRPAGSSRSGAGTGRSRPIGCAPRATATPRRWAGTGRGEDIAPLVQQGEELTQQLGDADKELTRRAGGARALAAGAAEPAARVGAATGPTRAPTSRLRRHGEPRQFAFAPRDHVEIGERLGRLDFEAAGRISGARFVVMRGAAGATAPRAGAVHARSAHREHGYTEVYAPYLVPRQALVGTGQLPKFEQDLFARARRARRSI